jgi:UDPglucose--hexose-1-phosphate uridylyltransferase
MTVNEFLMFTHPHRRYNALTGEWILVSPHRTQRPWQGDKEEISNIDRPTYDSNCYLCPGNSRSSGVCNPDYTGTFIFDNDFPALLPDTSIKDLNIDDLLRAKSEKGICRVMCFSPRHNLSIPEMDLVMIEEVINGWINQYVELSKFSWINHIQIFENKGAMMGASNSHPHCQIWANASIPTEPAKELNACNHYMKENESCLLCNYIELEIEKEERLVISNTSFIVVVPFWATWPFETLLISRRHVADLSELTSHECMDLADIFKRLTICYDNLFQISFPYSMGFHQRPTDGQAYSGYHLHAHFYPPLLRSATVRKFMVGYEMLGEPQRDITPEASARQLCQLPRDHFRTTQLDQQNDNQVG